MTFPITGIFTSHWNSDGSKPLIDWPQVKAAGFTYAWIKATDFWDGRHRTDIRFERDWDLAQASGLLVGSLLYHRPGIPPDGQADYHLEVLSSTGYGQLPHLLDVEEPAYAGRSFIDDIKRLLSDLEQSPLGRSALYANLNHLSTYSLYRAMHPTTSLSIAYWSRTGSAPGLPSTISEWHDWQWNCKANRRFQPKVPGITGDVCLHRFNGSEATFLEWLNQSTTPVPTYPVKLSVKERAAILSIASKLNPP